MTVKFVEIILGGNGIIKPEELISLIQAVEKRVPAGGTEGVVLSGRLPVWAYGALIHHYHPRPFIATFEPRLSKGVVVATHVKEVNIGDLVDLEGSERIVINFPEAEGVSE